MLVGGVGRAWQAKAETTHMGHWILSSKWRGYEDGQCEWRDWGDGATGYVDGEIKDYRATKNETWVGYFISLSKASILYQNKRLK